MTSATFMNPKVGASRDPVDSWYRYYAGYSAGFVEQALKESAATAGLLLDPWNGTGTTTVVAASKTSLRSASMSIPRWWSYRGPGC